MSNFENRPVLVNVSSFRLIIGFALSFDATTWVEQLGFLHSMAIYSGVLGLLSLGLPLVYIYGKRIRAFTGGKLDGGGGGGGTHDAKEGDGNAFPAPLSSDEEGVHVPAAKDEVDWQPSAPR